MRSFIFLLFIIVSPNAFSATQLLLNGGGTPPAAAISRFVEVAGGSQARILAVTWATDLPDDTMKQINAEFNVRPGIKILEAPRRPLTQESREIFLRALSGATGLFFSGGDQKKIMSVLTDGSLRQAIVQFYRSGRVVGGTSAGTAVMSPAMFTGDQSELTQGLGLLPGTLLDTHFLVRSRLGRLEKALQGVPTLLGIGVDQDNAVWVTDDQHVQMFGLSELTLVRVVPGGALQVKTLNPGQRFDLPKATH